jgi:ElaB/YqjD/DUF883 family membrane-anchored ribosome-binding protein
VDELGGSAFTESALSQAFILFPDVFPSMAVEQEPKIEIANDRVVIENLEVTDSEVLEYFKDHSERPPEEILQLALRVGVSTLRLSETSEEMEFVRREFDKVSQDFQQEIDDLRDELDDWFDEEEGDFSKLLDQTFGKDGDVVDEVFDHNDEDTPLGELYSDIEDKFQSLREEVLQQDARQEIEQQTRIKGEIFEDDLHKLLGDVTRKADEVERTGEEYGQRTDRFVGDFVVTLGETGQEIVIEAKDQSNLNKPEIKRELEEGIENRGADYGILVLKNEDAASDFLGAFREFDQQMLYVAISDEETDTYDKRLLNLAYEWARMRTLSEQYDTGEEVDPETIQSKIAEVEDSIEKFRDIRTECSNIKDARENIEEQLKSIQDDVEDQLAEITEELNVSE